MKLNEALALVQDAREKEEAVRDVLLEVRQDIDIDRDSESLQALFEASFPKLAPQLSSAAKETMFFTAIDDGPLLSAYNEYCSYMELAGKVKASVNTNFARPGNALATEVAESNNPIGALFSVIRKNKRLTDLQFATILEAAFPLATNGLDEETRDHLFMLANERGIDAVAVANVYNSLVELVIAIRFLEDELED